MRLHQKMRLQLTVASSFAHVFLKIIQQELVDLIDVKNVVKEDYVDFKSYTCLYETNKLFV